MTISGDKLRQLQEQTRRHFIRNCSLGLGGLAISSLLGSCNSSETNGNQNPYLSQGPMGARPPQFPGKIKNVIYIHMAGPPSQLELFDYKPDLAK